MSEEKSTPMMEQWKSCKSVAKDALLLFRMGDFYEAFYEDATQLANSLDLTLTKRGGIPMSGVPCVSKEGAVAKLVAMGLKVAIAEQMEDPKEAKGLVERRITSIITPGTTPNAPLEKQSNYIAALNVVGSTFGIAILELTTGEFRVTELENEEQMVDELYRLCPSELVITKKLKEKYRFEKSVLTFVESWQFEHNHASNYLTRHFALPSLDSFGLKGMVAAINSAGALLAYVHEELCLPIDHIRRITPINLSECLAIDRNCLRNLALMEELLPQIDKTSTPMGGRLLSNWLKMPLLSVEKIKKRQDAVQALLDNHLAEALSQVRDLERLMMKISSKIGSARDFVALSNSLVQIAKIRKMLEPFTVEAIVSARNMLHDVSAPISLIQKALLAEPALRIGEGAIFNSGYNKELDELKSLMTGARQWLASYQTKIKEQTGIKNLKVHFNKIFGYYIEVSKGQASLMPADFEKRQTLVNGERFISPELKEYEEKILAAEEKCYNLENELFKQLQEQVVCYREQIFQIAKAIAFIDVICSFAHIAKSHKLCRPVVDSSDLLEIVGGRHFTVESLLQERFIANDTALGGDKGRLMLITGPNMAGKSTYIRQVALIVIMAQMGSFVPASSAHIGVIDKIFTRIGANDDLTRGQSTFMVEMSETASILHNVTDRSLVILDEIGRGTSTYDGLSIAWAVAEFLLLKEGKRAKTLFATHYGELAELEKLTSAAVNYHAAVSEADGEIVFLHRIVPGATLQSYGIHVAKLAGLPFSVIARAQEVLGKLEAKKGKKHAPAPTAQLTFF